MRLFEVFAGLLAAASAVSGHTLGGRKLTRCGDPQPDAKFVKHSAALQRPFRIAALTTINTHFHVVTTKARKGAYPKSQLNKQLSVMNKAYAPVGIKFKLASTTFTANDNWAKSAPGDSYNVAMKNSLHKGGYSNLNVYFQSDLAPGTGLLGYCPFPYSDIHAGNSSYTSYIKYDGCLIAADSMPGGSLYPYDLGLTAVHEVGHWFGVYHVFQGNSCTGDGDYVADTPPQSTYTSGCPASKDTCAGGGLDSIHNYMDYSDDSCLNQFTGGQSDRLNAIYTYYRSCNGCCPGYCSA